MSKIDIGDIVYVRNNPKVRGYVTDIREHKKGKEQYYVQFFDGPLTDTKLVTYYYKEEITKEE